MITLLLKLLSCLFWFLVWIILGYYIKSTFDLGGIEWQEMLVLFAPIVAILLAPIYYLYEFAAKEKISFIFSTFLVIVWLLLYDFILPPLTGNNFIDILIITTPHFLLLAIHYVWKKIASNFNKSPE